MGKVKGESDIVPSFQFEEKINMSESFCNNKSSGARIMSRTKVLKIYRKENTKSSSSKLLLRDPEMYSGLKAFVIVKWAKETNVSKSCPKLVHPRSF
jgi:hypothetical protein